MLVKNAKQFPFVEILFLLLPLFFFGRSIQGMDHTQEEGKSTRTDASPIQPYLKSDDCGKELKHVIIKHYGTGISSWTQFKFEINFDEDGSFSYTYNYGKNVKVDSKLASKGKEIRELVSSHLNTLETLATTDPKTKETVSCIKERLALKKSDSFLEFSQEQAVILPSPQLQRQVAKSQEVLLALYDHYETLTVITGKDSTQQAAEKLVAAQNKMEHTIGSKDFVLTHFVDDPRTGLKVGLYRNSAGDLYLAFAGTQFQKDNLSSPAFLTDVVADMTGGASQLKSYSNAYREISEILKQRMMSNPSGDLIICAHSLGGRPASRFAHELAKHMDSYEKELAESGSTLPPPKKFIFITFNSLQMMEKEKDRNLKAESKYIESLNLSNAGDFVTASTGDRIGDTLTFPKRGLSYLQAHSLESFTDLIKDEDFVRKYPIGPSNKVKGHGILYPSGATLFSTTGNGAQGIRWWAKRKDTFEKLRRASELYSEQVMFPGAEDVDPFKDSRELIANDETLPVAERKEMQSLNAKTDKTVEENYARKRAELASETEPFDFPLR